jgi:hypothetical protein
VPYPGGWKHARRLRDNLKLRKHVDYPPGHAKNPLSDAQLEVKFHRSPIRRWSAVDCAGVDGNSTRWTIPARSRDCLRREDTAQNRAAPQRH